MWSEIKEKMGLVFASKSAHFDTSQEYRVRFAFHNAFVSMGKTLFRCGFFRKRFILRCAWPIVANATFTTPMNHGQA